MFGFVRSMRARLGLLGLSTAFAATAASGAYPEKPIRLVVPFAPGGGTDLIARTLGAGMSQELGQPIIVDNKPGAGTIIGTEAVAKSPADGYTILIATFAHAVNPSLHAKLPYVNDKAFAPIILIGRGPNVLVVRADSPYKTVKDVIAAAKAAPDKLTYASQGNGTSAHLAGEMFNNLAKVEMTHVPYRGAGPAITDLLGGQVDMIFGTAAAVSSFVDSGKLRAIAVTARGSAHRPSRTCRPSPRPYRATWSRAGTACMRPPARRPTSSRSSTPPQRRPRAAPSSQEGRAGRPCRQRR